MIEIVPYNPQWPTEYATIAQELRHAIAPVLPEVEIFHIGSTSVPDLIAKDRIDIQVSVPTYADLDKLRQPLEALGYGWRDDVNDHIPAGWQGDPQQWEKRYAKCPPNQRPRNVHIRVRGYANWRYALLFRDYLRANADAATAYGRLKQGLAKVCENTHIYSDTKDPAIDLIMQSAEVWAKETNWQAEVQDKQFKLNMAGLLEVLAGSLYANQNVGLRELIQNAHDSCTRRHLEEELRFYRPKIHIETDPEKGILTVHDNGSGLTAVEIDDYLATIGRSYTRGLRDNLTIFNPDEASDLIGQFGFGFLSAFMLASDVTLITKSWRPDSPALRWHSAGGESYHVENGQREEIGTTVHLKLKVETSYLLDEALLVEKIQEYSDFLTIPITVNDQSDPVNLMQAPWDAPNPAQAIQTYIQRIYGAMEPLAVIQLHDHTIELEDDEVTVPLNGFVFIPPASMASVREYGDLRVYIRRMFITNEETDLLPPWARFVRGVIDCPYLQPTASRETIRQDETFFTVQDALHAQLTQAMQRIAEEEPILWRRIVDGHTDVMMGWAVRDDAFFSQVADILTLRTSQGRLTMSQYLQRTGGRVYYVTREITSLQEKVLAEGNDTPVIEAVWFAVKPFLQKYAALFGGVDLIAMDGDAQALMPRSDEGPMIEWVATYTRLGVSVQVSRFAPTAVPAVMLYPEDAEFRLEAESARNELADPIAGLVGAFLDEQPKDDLAGTLYLNADSPIWEKLVELPPTKLEAAAQLIYQVARLFAGRTLNASRATEAFDRLNEALQELSRR